MTRYLITSLLSVLFVYLLIAFVKIEIDFTKWEEGIRQFFAVSVPFTIALAICFVNMYQLEKESK